MSKTQDAVKIAKAVGEKSASIHIHHVQLIYKHNAHKSKWSPQMYRNIQDMRENAYIYYSLISMFQQEHVLYCSSNYTLTKTIRHTQLTNQGNAQTSQINFLRKMW
jgi:hypothetical protein